MHMPTITAAKLSYQSGDKQVIIIVKVWADNMDIKESFFERSTKDTCIKQT